MKNMQKNEAKSCRKLSTNNRHIHQKSKFKAFSEVKAQRLTRGQIDVNNYCIILNKALSFNTYDSFLKYTKNFVNRKVLEGLQEPNLSKQEGIGRRLISDGIFIKHLAEISPATPTVIINRFAKCIRKNRKIFKNYVEKIIPNISSTEHIEDWQNTSESQTTELSKQLRFNGLTKKKPTSIPQDKSKVKIMTFKDYIESNRKSINMSEIKQRMHQSITNKTEAKSESCGYSQNKLKRPSIIDLYIPALPLQPATRTLLDKLPLFQKNIVEQYFPCIKHIGFKDKQITIIGQIQSLGYVQNCQVMQIAIEFEDPQQLPQTSIKYGDKQIDKEVHKVVDLAAIAYLRKPQNINNHKTKKLSTNRDIRIFVSQ